MNEVIRSNSLPSQGPRILVVLPTIGDRLDTLLETLDSIDQQRHEVDLNLVVVAPTTAVEARALASSYGASIVDDPKKGISEAINRGIDSRRGEEFYAWIGDDDLFRPGGLKLLQKLLDANTDAVVSYGGCDYINSKSEVAARFRPGRWALFLLPWGPDLIPHPGSMIRLDALEAVGRFDPRLKFAMDLDVFLKLRKHGKFVFTTKAVSAFRWHPDSLTVASRKSSSLESEAVKAKHLPGWIRPIRALWQYPVRWASAVAALRVTRKANSEMRMG